MSSQRPHIIVVEDDDDHRRLLVSVLEREGWTVTAVSEATTAVRAVAEEQPNLLLLDVAMPGQSGFELLARLRTQVFPRLGMTPRTLFITGKVESQSAVRGYSLGATDYIRKPWDPDELVARLRSALEQQNRVEELTERASRDALTGLWNAAQLREQLAEAVVSAEREGRTHGLIALDLDHFKAVNDSHGHAAGDAVLAESTQRVLRSIRPYDHAFRSGGEEFVVLAVGATLDESVSVARRICQATRSRPIQLDNVELNVTFSAGTAVSAPGLSPSAWLDRADRMLYRAKRRGRDRVEAWREPPDRAHVLSDES